MRIQNSEVEGVNITLLPLEHLPRSIFNGTTSILYIYIHTKASNWLQGFYRSGFHHTGCSVECEISQINTISNANRFLLQYSENLQNYDDDAAFSFLSASTLASASSYSFMRASTTLSSRMRICVRPFSRVNVDISTETNQHHYSLVVIVNIEMRVGIFIIHFGIQSSSANRADHKPMPTKQRS